MAQHVSRKELKTDEVRDTFMDGIRAIVSHQQATLYIVIVALWFSSAFSDGEHMPRVKP